MRAWELRGQSCERIGRARMRGLRQWNVQRERRSDDVFALDLVSARELRVDAGFIDPRSPVRALPRRNGLHVVKPGLGCGAGWMSCR